MQVGFDRFIRLQWLDQALELALSAPSEEAARTTLDSLLSQEIAGEEARNKVVRRLDTIWIHPPQPLRSLRDRALELFVADSARGTTLPLHWGMTMAAYPFFGVVAERVGQMLTFHDAVSGQQVVRRVQETHGDRPTVKRAAQRVLQTIADWDVVDRDEATSQLRPMEKLVVSDERLVAWLLEAALHARQVQQGFLSTLLFWPAFFPIEIRLLDERTLETGGRLSLHRQGVSQDVLMLEG